MSPGKHPVASLAVHGFKSARPAEEWPDLGRYSLGLVTGERAGFGVLDVDEPEAEKYWLSVAPSGYRVRTGGGGVHLYIQHRAGRVCGARSYRGQFVYGTDFRFDGGYVLDAESSHVSGKKYAGEGDPNDIPEWEFEKFLPHGPRLAEGERNVGLTSVAGRLRRDGHSVEEIILDLRRENLRCDPPLPWEELETIARSVGRYPLGTRSSKRRPAATELEESAPSAEEPIAAKLVELAQDAELFHDEFGEVYATVRADRGQENLRIKSGRFRRWLTYQCYRRLRLTPGEQAFRTAINLLASRAQFEGPSIRTYTRVGFEGGTLWIDLGGNDGRVVQVTSTGWEVCDSSPVKFVRGPAQLRLPEPVRGGSLATLAPLLNASGVDDEHFVLSVAWALGAFHPSGPYPILYLLAEQGSGKSSGARYLRGLVDSSKVPLRSLPREERDLAVAAKASWVLSFDNVSAIPGWLSDALCRLSTGGGFGARALYSDDDEALFGGSRPILLNGIPMAVSEADLRDRVLVARWPVLTSRRRDRELEQEFRARSGGWFGALLDAIVAALAGTLAARGPSDELPRMADFYAWVIAAEVKLPWSPGRFAAVYKASRTLATESALAESLLGQTVLGYVSAGDPWEGTATDLLHALTTAAELSRGGKLRQSDDWPRSAKALGRALRKIAPDLRSAGAWVTFDREGKDGKRTIRLSGRPESPLMGLTSVTSETSAVDMTEADITDKADVSFATTGVDTSPASVDHPSFTPALDMTLICARFGLDPDQAFPNVRFHAVPGDPSRVVMVSRRTAEAIGRPWVIGHLPPAQPAEDKAE